MSNEPVISRRSLCVGLGGTAVLAGLGCLKFVGDDALLRPPGGQDEATLLAQCIRCEKCYEVCPRHVIKLAHLEDGIVSVRTPVMNFYSDWCDYCEEENDGKPLCVDVCPTAALVLPEGATAENTIIGEAELNQDLCLAYKLLNGCHFCVDACPYEALSLDNYNRPVLNLDTCNGCGACESVCVSMQNGSISAGASERAIVVRPIQN
jgi:ferredoxin-type protein NapG